ncbi:MAG: hypothetical protein E6Q97_25000 [Desulfurellales bacterium]|nr:MAG: hypothetical protein E6Q97_25000 [Desulfurellales bacterium]
MAKRNSTSNSSMPTTPVIRRWNRQTRARVSGRWALIGFVDGPAIRGFLLRTEEDEYPRFFTFEHNEVIGVMGYDPNPGQVIDIGPKVMRDCPYHKSKNGDWSVEG